MIHPSVAERLARLAPDQRAAATSPPGPVLCVAPAGSGKTTTLVARVAWLVDGGVARESITVVAFNKRAADELAERIAAALAPLGDGPPVRVRTFHALGREMLAEAGVDVAGLVGRDEVLRALFPEVTAAGRGRLDLAFSRLKLDLGVTGEEVARDPAPGPVARAFAAYERHLAETGALDFDDLVARAVRLLDGDAAVLGRWRARCAELLVDEAQDLDRTQLRLALHLAAPANRVFLVGDDDQTIYGWRLADVRRVLGLAAELPGLRRVDLVTNYRCPRPVVERAVRLVERNRERFAKRIVAGPSARGRLVLAPDAGDETTRIARAMRSWPADEPSRAVLARTNRELLPAVAVAVELGWPFRAPDLALPTDDPRLEGLLARAGEIAAGTTGADVAAGGPVGGAAGGRGLPPLVALGRMRDELAGVPPPDDGSPSVAELASTLLGWAARLGPAAGSIDNVAAAVGAWRARVAALRRDDAALVLATAHGTKGLEWDHVLVLADGFPGRRSVSDATEPERALEEERRLAYVAWTRARRSLTLLYDPAAPSPFLREAFDDDELGLDAAVAA